MLQVGEVIFTIPDDILNSDSNLIANFIIISLLILQHHLKNSIMNTLFLKMLKIK